MSVLFDNHSKSRTTGTFGPTNAPMQNLNTYFYHQVTFVEKRNFHLLFLLLIWLNCKDICGELDLCHCSSLFFRKPLIDFCLLHVWPILTNLHLQRYSNFNMGSHIWISTFTILSIRQVFAVAYWNSFSALATQFLYSRNFLSVFVTNS